MLRLLTHVTRFILPAGLLAGALSVAAPRPATALEIGKPAPDFALPSTTGEKIGLKRFRGKWVLIEFYGAAFAPV
jgi:cytochrome oxidase Cu insertion factor (SCO1/SenC/PrrC family)